MQSLLLCFYWVRFNRIELKDTIVILIIYWNSHPSAANDGDIDAYKKNI